MRSIWIVAAAVLAVAVLVFPSVSDAASPPDPNDPCSRAGRDACGTLGVGFYRRSRYGIRWFGDYRRAIAGETHSFCLDLGYWYASPGYRYRLQAAAMLRTRAGVTVSPEHRQELAYAIWRYGRSAEPGRQAAVMLYVHSRIGDGRPGELDPATLGPGAASLYRRIARDSRRYHGPYRIEARLPGTLTVGRRATAMVSVVSARGYPLPHVRIALSARGVSGLPARLETNSAGVAAAALTPTVAGRLVLRLATGPLAAPQPRVFVPTAAAAAANGQRLAVPAAQAVTATVSRSDVSAAPRLTTRVSSQLALPGARIADLVSVKGLGGASARVRVELWGPFASRSTVRCTGLPYWAGSFVAHGDSTTRTTPVLLRRAGFYAYRERLAGSPLIAATTTPCATASETTLAAPRIVTGRGDVAAYAAARAAGSRRPVRIRIPKLGIDAPVSPAAIDVAHGVLGIPANIERVGWWRDGMAPGAVSGSILLAGHVDSARAGKGALFPLARATAGDLVRLTTAAGQTVAYRVATIQSYPKSALPMSVYSSAGPARLVVVTCGGRFDPAAGHYPDNIVITALPTR